jgi:hypothetical protein
MPVSQRLFGVVTRFKTSRIKPLTSDDVTLPGPVLPNQPDHPPGRATVRYHRLSGTAK